jgi:hypothetical protein
MSTSLRKLTAYGLLLASLVVVGYLVPTSTRLMEAHDASKTAETLILMGIAVALGGFVFVRLAPRDLSHPFGFPFAYISLTLCLPILYILVTRLPIGGVGPADVTLIVVEVFLATIVGFAAGVAVGLVLTSRKTEPVADSARVDFRRALVWGRRIEVLAVACQAFLFPGLISHAYGFGSLGYGPKIWLGTISSGLIFIGVAVTAVANLQLTGSPLNRTDIRLFVAFAVLTLVAGARGELIAPALFLAWMRHTYVKPVKFWKGLAGGMVMVLLFAAVSANRVHAALPFNSRDAFVERTLGAVSTPLWLTTVEVQHVPSDYPFTRGSTYVAAIGRQLPGPVARAILGPPTNTGSQVFRKIIGFNDPNAGFSFSLPSEGYLNFGIAGALAAAILVGLFFGYAYKRVSPRPSKPVHLLYPVLFATLPLNLRSDAVLQIKSVLYTMIGITLVFAFARLRTVVHHAPAPLPRGARRGG